ncbi:MAG: porin family protein [Cytophagales bacterium]
MQTHSFNFWHQFHLHWRKLIFLSFFFASFCSFSQTQSKRNRLNQQDKYEVNKVKKDINLPNYDEKFLHYGFFLGLNYDRTILKYSEAYFSDSIYKSITPLGEGGFSLGFLMNFRLHDQVAFKIVPSVGFYTRSVNYQFSRKDTLIGNPIESVQAVETSFIEMQFLVKYRSLRRKNTRMYVVAGVKPSIRAGGKKSEDGQPTLGISRFDFSIEYGAGIEIYFPYFKWSPELRFSHGLINLRQTGGLYNTPLQALYTHTVSLYFFFE